MIIEKKKFQGKKLPTFIWVIMGVIFLAGIGYATTVSENSISINNVNLTKTATITMGFDNTADFNVNNYASADLAWSAVLQYLNNTNKRGTVLMRSGVYNFKAAVNFTDLQQPRCCMKIMGEGSGTIIIKNHTVKSGTTYSGTIFNLGGSDPNNNGTKMWDMEFSHFRFQVENESVGGGVVGGTPNGNAPDSSKFHENVRIHDIIGYDIHGRFTDINVNNLEMYNIYINGSRGIYGGKGDYKRIHDNTIISSNVTGVSEYEGVEVNNVFYYADIHDNVILNFYEQGVDCSNRYCHVNNNFIQMSIPTYQTCVTVGSNGVVTGNTCFQGRNGTGTTFAGIEAYGNATGILVANNHIIGNFTDANHLKDVVCLRIGSHDSVITGNILENCKAYQNSSDGKTGYNNFYSGNILRNTTGTLDHTPNSTVNDYDSDTGTNIVIYPNLFGTGNALSCINSLGQFYRGNATACP
jgi:hypothetical protein